MRVLLIDDRRDLSEVCRAWGPAIIKMTEGITARTYAAGIEELKVQPKFDVLYLDHDLGEEKTGYDILCWLEQNPKYCPLTVMVVTQNPVGRQRLRQVLTKLYWYDKFETGIVFTGCRFDDEGNSAE